VPKAADAVQFLSAAPVWIERYPILSIEDPLAEDDPEGFAAFTKAGGNG
jgi:enolase